MSDTPLYEDDHENNIVKPARHEGIDLSEYTDKSLPNESAKQFARFCAYRDMNPVDRSLAMIAKRFDASAKTIEHASAKYGWVARALAYDEKMQAVEMVIRETGIEDAIKTVTSNEDKELIALSEIVQKKMRQTLEHLEDVDPELDEGTTAVINIQRLVATVEKLQNMRRRRVGLPVTYKAEVVDDIDYASEEFLIGGGSE